MAMPYLNCAENPLNFQKLKKNPKNSNPKSFLAFLLSIFIYISVFYVFNLSPSTLLCTTKFWFIISNTLILIIAADFGAFSSPKEHDFHDYECDKNNLRSSKSSAPSFEIQYVRFHQKTMPKYDRKRLDDEVPQEKIIGTIAADDDDHSKNQEILENKHEIFINKEEDGHQVEKTNEEFKKMEEKCVLIDQPSEKARISKAATVDEEWVRLEEKDDEFSRMSDEEVNRRVEEFIRRFNRQIRLQAARNRRQDSEVLLHRM